MDKVYVVVVTAFDHDEFCSSYPVGVFTTKEEALSSAITLQNEFDAGLEDHNSDYRAAGECFYHVWETSFGRSRDNLVMYLKGGVWCEEEHE